MLLTINHGACAGPGWTLIARVWQSVSVKVRKIIMPIADVTGIDDAVAV